MRKELDKMKSLMNESSLSRIKNWIFSKDIAGVTAFRYRLTNVTPNTLMDIEGGEIYSKVQNIRRNRALKSALIMLHYGVTKVAGSYIEKQPDAKDIELQEESFVVVNLNDDPKFKDNIARLSEYYNQDSFLFKEKDNLIASLVGTNNAIEPGYKQVVEVGQFHEKVNATYMSRIRGQGYAFSFNDDFNPLSPHTAFGHKQRKDQRIAMMDANKKADLNEICKVLDMDVFKNLQINSKRLCEYFSKDVLKILK